MDQPPVIKPPVRMKGKTYIALSLLAVFGGWVFYTYFMPHPPKESELIRDFYAHRDTYERLRDMFQADGHVNRVASYGVALTNSGVHFPTARKPEEVGFPVDRYNEYLVLLKQAGALLASRREWEGTSDPIFLVWVFGGLDFTRHIAICWKDQEPTNLVTSLDEYYRTRRRVDKRQGVYRHIDGHWYLWTDL